MKTLQPHQKTLSQLPSVDEILHHEIVSTAAVLYGRNSTVRATRLILEHVRKNILDGNTEVPLTSAIAAAVLAKLEVERKPKIKRIFNLTGTVLHTNLGRAVLPEEAIAAAVNAMSHPVSLEFDLETGGRGERDETISEMICQLTGVEDCIVVNNNAAAVILVLNTLARKKETVISRGELIEIGGAFRMPDIMDRAGTQLREIGTTNRTHLKDYEYAISSETGCIIKVHTSNYKILGFSKDVSTNELSQLCKKTNIPLIDDLGSGTLLDLSQYGLRHERTVQEAVKDGANLITFSADKLLGGPQAGFIIGTKELVRACQKNPMKRAMRLDKVRLAALEATLRLYFDPQTLPSKMPTLRFITKSLDKLKKSAYEILNPLQKALGDKFSIEVLECKSQIGSGALPLETLPSFCVGISLGEKQKCGPTLNSLAKAFRSLPIPVVGRIADEKLLLDVRTLDDEATFVDQIVHLGIKEVNLLQ